MIEFKRVSGGSVFINPAMVTHIEGYEDNRDCRVYLSGGQSVQVEGSAPEVAGRLR